MEAQEQAKQLDSVTDKSDDKEVDATRAQQAMSALGKPVEKMESAPVPATVTISRNDIDYLVSELEITEEMALKTLREVATEKGKSENDTLVMKALRKLVTT